MTYEDMVDVLAQMIGLSRADIRKVIIGMPLVLAKLKPGEHVVTPLGTFVMTVTKARPCPLPDGTACWSTSEKVVKLRPSKKRLRRPAS